ncbi:MAG: polysaccharide deacetylase family protein [Acidobacteriota bacterium]
MSVLAWHEISDRRSPTAVPPRQFAAQLDALEHMGRPVIALEQAVRRPGDGVALTFDDGHRDTYTTAFPLLADRGLTATVYVTTGYVSTRDWFEPGGEALTWADLAEMAAAGWTIGSHTVSHPRLTELPLAELRRELEESRAILQERLGRDCTHFCAPYGDMNRAVLHTVLQSGYSTAAVSVPPRHRLPGRLPAIVWRSGVYPDTSRLAYRLKARGWDRWLRGRWFGSA